MDYTYQEIGARVRSRQPDAFTGFSDEQIGQRVAERNPEVAKLVRKEAPVQPQAPVEQPEKKGLLGGIASGIGNIGIGIAKGVGSTLAGASALGEKMLSAPLKAVGMKTPTDFLGERIQESEALKPEGMAQKIGFGAEQIGEFFIPGGAPAKAAKAASVGLKLGKAEQAVGAISKATEAAKGLGRLGVRAGTEAGTFAGQTALQQGGITPEVESAAKWGAALPVVGKALTVGGKAVGGVLGLSPEKLINSLIKPLGRDFAFGKNAGRGVAREGIVANTWDDLIEKLGTKVDEIGSEIGSAVRGSSAKVSLRGAMSPLDDAISKASTAPTLNATLISRLKTAKKDIGAMIGKKKFLTPEDAFAVKQKVADLTKFTEPLTDSALNKALKGIYGNIKEELNKAVPAVRSLNERYADIKTAHIAAKYREKIVERQNVLSLSSKITGGIAGFSVASIPGSLLGVITATLVEKSISSVAVKTRVAKVLQALSVSERREAFKNPIVKAFMERVFGSPEKAAKIIENPLAPRLKLRK